VVQKQISLYTAMLDIPITDNLTTDIDFCIYIWKV